MGKRRKITFIHSRVIVQRRRDEQTNSHVVIVLMERGQEPTVDRTQTLMSDEARFKYILATDLIHC